MNHPIPHLAVESTSNYVDGELRDFEEKQALSHATRITLRNVVDGELRRDVAAEKENIK